MDRGRFTEASPGELVRIDVPTGRDWAFIPAPLPPQWECPARLWPLLSDAKFLLGKLDGAGARLGRPTLLLSPLQQREAHRSSTLEGTLVEPVQLLLYEQDPREPTSERDEANAWREVGNHSKALRHGFDLLNKGLPLCLRLIREIHGVLLRGVRGQDRRPGEFRTRQVHVRAGRQYIPPPPQYLAGCLDAFEKYLHNCGEQYDPVVLCYLVHYQFEAIHPFTDGNGRVGRVLLSLMVYSLLKQHLPWLYMSAYFERYKDEYFDNLFRVSTHGDWSRWIEFCLRGTVEQCEDAIRRCDRLDALRIEYQGRTSSLSSRMHKIVDELFHWPVFKVSDMQRRCDVARPTAQADIDKLVDAGVVKQLEGYTPKTYYAPAILNIAYYDDVE